jgi:drug/metabolite transporter (DMT)-like permease
MDLHNRTATSDVLLLLTATLWGFAFVAQRVGMDYIGPFTFNGIRFALGCFSLLPLILLTDRFPASPPALAHLAGEPHSRFTLVNDACAGGHQGRFAGIVKAISNMATPLLYSGSAGVILFCGASLQQAGLVYTTAGKAAFITGLYVVLVPILGVFCGHRAAGGTWTGAILAAVGLYFLSVTEQLTLARGDLLVLIGAFFWAGHVLVLGWLSPKMNPLKLAFMQFAVCSLLSLVTAAFFEMVKVEAVLQAGIPILYGGLISVGVAYTLQVVAQRNANPAHAGILLSMESVFAALGGYFLLGEILSGRALFGCTLMFIGMLSSQLCIHIPKPQSIFSKG